MNAEFGTILITSVIAIITTLVGRAVWDTMKNKSHHAQNCVDVHDNSASSHPDIRLQLSVLKLAINEVLDIVKRIDVNLAVPPKKDV